MRKVSGSMFIVLLALGLIFFTACERGEEAVEEAAEAPAGQEITQEELTAAVPELTTMHEVVYPLWHTAYPNKDFALVKELLPQADERMTALDGAELPGILRDKQAAWDERKTGLKDALSALHAAVEAEDGEAILKSLETFHSGYEGLVRTIRPLVPALDAVHQELYKLYHYYAPEFDLDNIRLTATAMLDKMEPLKAAQLPGRLEDRKEAFDAAVMDLDGAVRELVEVTEGDDKEAILQAVEKVHTAYQGVEKIFD
jgi:hypothetical protein